MRSDRLVPGSIHNQTLEWRVSQCACGQLTLRLGAMRIEFSRTEFARLHDMVQQAMSDFGVAPSISPTGDAGARRH